MGYETGKLYKIKSDGLVDGGNGGVGIRLSGASLSCLIYGSDRVADSISEMENIRAPEDLEAITASGWYNFSSLPNYIAFVGVADTIEMTNLNLQEIKDIS